MHHENLLQKLEALLVVSLVVMALAALKAEAHTLWINLSEHYPRYGYTNASFGWGHRFPLDDFLSAEALASFELIRPDAARTELSPGPGGYLATRVELSEPGNYIVAASLAPAYYTMYREDGEVHHKVGPKTGVTGQVLLSALHQQNAKALVTVGAPEWNPEAQVVGHRLEIIPLTCPYRLAPGDKLQVRVLFDGKPAVGVEVTGIYFGPASTTESPLWSKTADENGIATVPVQHATVGASLAAVKQQAVWMLSAIVRQPAPPELADKCNELWFTATLTLEVP
ncbi:DUF4198 domain-containing protein [bacterium]|nr:DUF4198 domain-containing protein [bacterium]